MPGSIAENLPLDRVRQLAGSSARAHDHREIAVRSLRERQEDIGLTRWREHARREVTKTRRGHNTDDRRLGSGRIAKSNAPSDGVGVGQYRWAIASVMTTTSGVLSRSAGVNVRPRTSGMPSVVK